jgi:hypothetical protein
VLLCFHIAGYILKLKKKLELRPFFERYTSMKSSRFVIHNRSCQHQKNLVANLYIIFGFRSDAIVE